MRSHWTTVILGLALSASAFGQDIPTVEPSLNLLGHKAFVRGVAFSKDGKFLASAGEDAAILWNLATGEVKHQLVAPAGPTKSFSVAFAPDGKSVAVGGYLGKVFLFDIDTGKHEYTFEQPSLAVKCLAFSPDGKILAALHDQANIMLFDVASKELLSTLKPPRGNIASFSFSSDGKTIAAITQTSLTIWDVASKSLKKSIETEDQSPLSGFFSVACSPTMPIVAASGGGAIGAKTSFWDLKTFALRGSLLTDELESTHSVLRFSPDGKILASGGSARNNQSPVSFWDVSTGTRVAILHAATDEGITQIAFSPDGRRVAASYLDKAVRVWDLGAPASGSAAKTKSKAKAKAKAKTKKSAQ